MNQNHLCYHYTTREKFILSRLFGGDDRVRTDDPHNAIVVLFQLSYIPVKDSFITPHRPTCVNLYFYFFSTTFLLFFCPSDSILYFSAAKIRLGRFFIYLSFFSTPANRFPRRTSRGDSIRISTMTIVSKQICLFAVAALFALPACAPKKEQPKQKLSDVVEVAYPVKKDIETWDSFTARIEGVKSVQIRSRVSGYLEKILFTDGDAFLRNKGTKSLIDVVYYPEVNEYNGFKSLQIVIEDYQLRA